MRDGRFAAADYSFDLNTLIVAGSQTWTAGLLDARDGKTMTGVHVSIQNW